MTDIVAIPAAGSGAERLKRLAPQEIVNGVKRHNRIIVAQLDAKIAGYLVKSRG